MSIAQQAIELFDTDQEVLTWDFEDIDAEPKKDIEKLQDAVDAIERLKTFKRSVRIVE